MNTNVRFVWTKNPLRDRNESDGEGDVLLKGGCFVSGIQ